MSIQGLAFVSYIKDWLIEYEIAILTLTWANSKQLCYTYAVMSDYLGKLKTSDIVWHIIYSYMSKLPNDISLDNTIPYYWMD